MKKILLSKGIFEITNSLYESIKKNNPELLNEDSDDFIATEYPHLNQWALNKILKNKLGDEDDKSLSREDREWIKDTKKAIKKHYNDLISKEFKNSTEALDIIKREINDNKKAKEEAERQFNREHHDSDEYENYIFNDDQEMNFDDKEELCNVLKEWIKELVPDVLGTEYKDYANYCQDRYVDALNRLLDYDINKTSKERLKMIFNCAKKELNELKERIKQLKDNNLMESENKNNINAEDIFRSFKKEGIKGVDKLINNISNSNNSSEENNSNNQSNSEENNTSNNSSNNEDGATLEQIQKRFDFELKRNTENVYTEEKFKKWLYKLYNVVFKNAGEKKEEYITISINRIINKIKTDYGDRYDNYHKLFNDKEILKEYFKIAFDECEEFNNYIEDE